MWFPSGSEQNDSKMFVARALERMLAERDIKRSNNAALRKAAQDALERIQRDQQQKSSAGSLPTQQPTFKPQNNVPLPAPGEVTERTAAQQSIEPFTLALKSQSKRLTIIAIDCLQKLIAYNHLTSEDAIAGSASNGTTSESTGGATNVIERICEDICSCFNSTCADDDVYLQIVKALLTIMASDRVQVHGDTLLLIIRTCYNVYLFGKQRVVQETASGSLVQMLNKIMSHVEDSNNLGRVTSGKPQLTKISTTPAPSDDRPAEEAQNVPTDFDDFVDPDVLLLMQDVLLAVEDEDELSSSLQTPTTDDVAVSSLPDVHALYAARCRSAAAGDISIDNNDAVSIRSSEDATGTNMPLSPTSTARQPHTTPQRAISIVSTASVSPHVTAVGRNSARPLPTATSFESDSNIPPSSPSPALTVYEKDALNVFRSLCKLSTKEMHDAGGSLNESQKNIEFRNKVLCLRLLLAILEGINMQTSVLRQTPFFIEALRKYMCLSLSKNGVSPQVEVFQLSLSIFLQLVFKFRVHLKVQTGVMFKEIFLNILESSSSSYAHKLAVVDALTKVCSDAQLIVDLFVNYDCDLSAPNVFARLIDNLSRVAQGKNAHALGGTSQAAPNIQQQATIRLKGFEALSSILTCLVEWLCLSKQQPRPIVPAVVGEQTSISMPRVESSASQLSDSGDNMPNGNDVDETLPTLSARLEEVKIQKDIVEQGVALFAKKPRRGLEFLQQHGIVGDSADEISKFFHSEERLDKSQIGDLLSENNDYSRAIMHAYVDAIDFAGKDIVSALRQFLEKFRLPGEAQKIDRLMEKFASRYCETNSDLDIFASADTAYVLAYSIIMLTTDLHSPQVKHKMTKEQYIRMNRGINDQQDLPEEFLSKIFDEIAVNEIRMKPTISAVQPAAGGTAGGGPSGASGSAGKNAADSSATSRQKQLLYNLEMEQVSKVAHALMESASHIKSEFLEARDTHFVKPIFKLLWTPLLAAFSILLQDAMSLRQSIVNSTSSNSNSKEVPTLFGSEERDYYAVSIALQSLRKGMHIACRYLLELERDAYLQALVGFTHLSASPSSGSSSGVAGGPGVFTHQHSVSSSNSYSSSINVSATVVDEKNLLAVREIIRIAQEDGNYLGYSNWHEILKRISQLDLTHIVQDRDKILAAQQQQRAASNSSGTKLMFFRDPVSALIPGLNANKNLTNEKLTMDESSTSSQMNMPASAAGTLSRTKSRATQDRALASTSPVAFAILQCLDESEMQDFLVSIDRIFSASTQLDGESVVTFVRALCAVSLEELRQQPRPKIFCLQKIVEISYYNMDRVRLQWSRIWQIMSEYYKHVFLLENEEISCFAVDSLRQLSVKFLEKAEVAHFRFQNEFLKPFEFVLKKTQSNIVRDMTVRCIVHIANSQAPRLRSGWKNIFNVWFIVAAAAPLPSSPSNASSQLNAGTKTDTLQRSNKQQSNAKTKKLAGGRKPSAAPDDDAVSISSQTATPSAHVQLLEISFEALSNVVLRVYEKHFVNCVESFQDCIKCLSEFACTDEAGAPDMSMEAIRLIRRCADTVADNESVFNERLVLMPSSAQNNPIANSSVETPTVHNKSIAASAVAATPVTATASSIQIAASHERAWVNGWFPVIFELTCVVCRCKLDVRTRALTVLFEILKTHGRRFKDVWWLDIFQVVLRMFDGLKLPDRQQHEKQEWMTTTCSHALFSIVDVVTQHFDVLGHLVIEQVYGLITWCIQTQQNNEQLARSAINCFETLVTTNAERFDAELWDKTCAAMCGLFDATLPVMLLQWQPPLTTTSAAAGSGDGSNFPNDEDDMSTISMDELSNGSLQQHKASKMRRTTRTGSVISTEDERQLQQRKPGGRPANLTVDGAEEQGRNYVQQRAANDLQAMLLNCVLQIELIQALDNMLFTSLGASRRQEAVIAKFFVSFDPYRTLETIRESAQTQALAAARTGANFTPAAASAVVGTSLTAFYATQKQLSPPPPRRLPINTPIVASADGNAASTAALPPATADRTAVESTATANSDEGVLKYLSSAQAIQLARVLQQSCMLARNFNLNDAQRELLWREGLCGRSKPNLFKQETYSFVTLIRLHFALVQRNLDKLSHARGINSNKNRNTEAEDTDEQQIKTELFSIIRTTIDLCNDTLVYYADTITHENHRQAWTAPVLTIAWSLVQQTLVSSIMAFLQDVVATTLSASKNYAGADEHKNLLFAGDIGNIPFLGLCEVLAGSLSSSSSHHWTPSKSRYHSPSTLVNGDAADADDDRIGDNIYVGNNRNHNAAVQLLDSQQALALAVYREFYRHLFLNLSKVFNLIESPVEVRKATQCLFALNYLLFIA